MARLSDQRRQAIYGAVHDRFMDARVDLRRMKANGILTTLTWEALDARMAVAADEAGRAAVEAAETGSHTRTWRTPTASEAKS